MGKTRWRVLGNGLLDEYLEVGGLMWEEINSDHLMQRLLSMQTQKILIKTSKSGPKTPVHLAQILSTSTRGSAHIVHSLSRCNFPLYTTYAAIEKAIH
jgi:hypothetical protein